MSLASESSLAEDLQRCRRLVATMRGQVLASSLKQQVLRQLVVVVNQQQYRWPGSVLSTPRECYLRERRVDHIITIQKQWRRHLLQKRIVAKLRVEQRWKTRQGISRFRKAAVTIQRVFRGFFVRKHRLDIASYLQNVVSRIQHLRDDREVYHQKCDNLQQELVQVRLDIVYASEKLSELEKVAARNAARETRPMSRDFLHPDVSEEIKHYKRELSEQNELERQLGSKLVELRESEPVVQRAAALIQAIFRGILCRMWVKKSQRDRQKAKIRMLRSKELCYRRMDLAWRIRNRQQWESSARIITGLYHIRQAKLERLKLRQVRAAQRIIKMYRETQARIAAKHRMQWQRAKLQASAMASRKCLRLIKIVWTVWVPLVEKETARRELVAKRVEAGMAKWICKTATWFLSAYRNRIAQRDELTRKVLQNLDPHLLQYIRAAVMDKGDDSSPLSALHSSTAFFLMVRKDIWTWKLPDRQFYVLSQRYKLPLDLLPMKEISVWLTEGDSSFVDLYAPLPTETLRILARLSHYFSCHTRILQQINQIRAVNEARMSIRDYLGILYSANLVRFSPATTFSSRLRQRAVQILQHKDKAEYLPKEGMNRLDIDRRNDFTTFHCLWNQHLCEGCLGACPGRQESTRCQYCGHYLYERNTVSKDLRLESLEVSDNAFAPNSMKPRQILWVSPNEKCDFIILNACLHAEVPLSDERRHKNSFDVLWKLAMATAYGPLAELHNRLRTGSLNELLSASSDELDDWTMHCCLPNVNATLNLFLEILKEELTAVNAQLSAEAQTEVFNTQTLKGEAVSSKLNSKLPRKKIKQQNMRLKPLNSNSTDCRG